MSSGPHEPLDFYPITQSMSSTITALKEFFGSRGVSAYLVGGHLRDALAGSSSKDIDITVKGDALALAQDLADRLCGTFVALDPKRRVARVVMRKDKSVVDVSSMDGSLQQDLARRDFTIDAMALPLDLAGADGWRQYIIDPFGGRDHLARSQVRMVGPSVFAEDPSRLIRAVRLARTLSFSIHKNTAAAIIANAHLVLRVSKERVRDEFLNLLSLKGAQETLLCLDNMRLLCHIIPELESARGVEQPKEHYWDVFEHTIQTVEAAGKVTDSSDRGDPLTAALYWNENMDSHFNEVVSDGHTRRTMLKLGALFHDIAKPQTKAVDSTGRTRFLGHPQLGAEMAAQRLRALRLSARGVRTVCAMVEYHLRPTQLSQGLERPSARAMYRFFRDLDETAFSVLYLSLADYMAAKGPMLEMDGWQRRVDLVNFVLAEAHRGLSLNPIKKKKPLVTGHDLINNFALEPGPIFRTLLEGLEEARAAAEVGTREEALAWIKTRLEEEGE